MDATTHPRKTNSFRDSGGDCDRRSKFCPCVRWADSSPRDVCGALQPIPSQVSKARDRRRFDLGPFYRTSGFIRDRGLGNPVWWGNRSERYVYSPVIPMLPVNGAPDCTATGQRERPPCAPAPPIGTRYRIRGTTAWRGMEARTGRPRIALNLLGAGCRGRRELLNMAERRTRSTRSAAVMVVIKKQTSCSGSGWPHSVRPNGSCR